MESSPSPTLRHDVHILALVPRRPSRSLSFITARHLIRNRQCNSPMSKRKCSGRSCEEDRRNSGKDACRVVTTPESSSDSRGTRTTEDSKPIQTLTSSRFMSSRSAIAGIESGVGDWDRMNNMLRIRSTSKSSRSSASPRFSRMVLYSRWRGRRALVLIVFAVNSS